MKHTLSVLLALAGAAPALAGECYQNATVQPIFNNQGIRAGANGINFFNIEAASNGAFASYGVARFDLTADKAALDAMFPQGWTVTGATLVVTEANAAFSAPLNVSIYYSVDDATIILNDGSNRNLQYDPVFVPGGNNQNVNNDGHGIARDADPVGSVFFPDTGNVNSGTTNTSNLTLSPGLLAKLQQGSSSSTVTLVFEAADFIGAATYAGYNHNTFAGPTLTIVAVGNATCGSADFDCDGDVGTDADIEAFFACIAGNCPAEPCTSNADFNADGDIGTDADIEAFFRVLGGGTC